MDIHPQRWKDDAEADLDSSVEILTSHLNAQIRRERKKTMRMLEFIKDLPPEEFVRRARHEWSCYHNRIAPMIRQRDWIVDQVVKIKSLQPPQPTILIAFDK